MSRFLLVTFSGILLLFIFLHFLPTAHAARGGCAIESGEKCVMVETAIGAIVTDGPGLIKAIFRLVMGLSGGIALILIIMSGYKFMTSGNNPESFQAAKETLTSAIVGLLFIIFSFVILEVIGVDILHIPGFEN